MGAAYFGIFGILVKFANMDERTFYSMNLPAAIALTTALFSIFNIHGNEVSRPEGWATCTSVYSAGDYELTGGNDGSLVVLRSDGSDMRDAILDAVVSHDVVVFDGVGGPFQVSSKIDFQSLSGRSLIGVNGAKLETAFSVTQEIHDLLDELDVKSLSQHAEDNLGGTLSNGAYVAEQGELTVRQALIDLYGDPKERYRYSGVFDFVGCSNIIIRNLDFAGPGSVDVGGADLVTLNGCDHVWVDHCRFTDGMDGNLDIVNSCDFVTVSDTHFRYTAKSYNHPLSNLTYGEEVTDGSPQKNNISWIRCLWDEGCLGRMPYTSFGIHHILNCFWDCATGSTIDAHVLSKLLIENSYFASKVRRAISVRDDDVLYEWRGSVWQGHSSPQSNASVSVPYDYTTMEVMAVPKTVRESAGPTIPEPYPRVLTAYPSTIEFGAVYANSQVDGLFNISAFGSAAPSSVTLTAPEGILLSTTPGGDYSRVLVVDAIDDNLLQADVYVKAVFGHKGCVEQAIVASTPERSFEIPVKAEVVGVEGAKIDASLSWPLDKGALSSSTAEVGHPEFFAAATFSLGEKLSAHSSQRIGGNQVFTLFNPTETLGRALDDDCFIEFDVTAAPGYVFIPKGLKFKAARMGTDMCYLDVECCRDSAAPRKLAAGLQPVRSSNAPYYSEVELPLGNAGVGETLRVRIYLYYMTANKQLALSDVEIEGDVYAAASGVEAVTVGTQEGNVEYFDLTGRRIERPRSGEPCLVRCNGVGAKIVRP